MSKEKLRRKRGGNKREEGTRERREGRRGRKEKKWRESKERKDKYGRMEREWRKAEEMIQSLRSLLQFPLPITVNYLSANLTYLRTHKNTCAVNCRRVGLPRETLYDQVLLRITHNTWPITNDTWYLTGIPTVKTIQEYRQSANNFPGSVTYNEPP